MAKTLISRVPRVVWPPLLDNMGAKFLATLHQIEEDQWRPAEDIAGDQFRQLKQVFSHAWATIPYYKEKFRRAGLRRTMDVNPDQWRRVPILSRTGLQQHNKTLISSRIPKEHGGLVFVRTSGSTGKSVKVTRTQLTNFFYLVFTLRDHVWHQRDLSAKMAIIRHAPAGKNAPPGKMLPNWDGASGLLYANTGPAVTINSNTPISSQAEWLRKENPGYLLTYPSNLRELAHHFMRSKRRLLDLKGVATLGEIVNEEIRKSCRDAWEIPLIDIYSCQEIGYIALQCPKSGKYHIQSENLLVEILDENGAPCKPGEIGRVVLTSLHNFAMPLIRYEIGDYAEVGLQCPCGRGLPTLNRIIGRVRNMVTLPSGDKSWPDLGSAKYDAFAIRQFQVIQHSLEEVEMKLVVQEPLAGADEKKLTGILQHSLGHDFRIRFTYMQEIPRSSGGKFEDFVSMI